MKIKILNHISDRATLIMDPFEEDSDCYVLKFFFKKDGFFDSSNNPHCYFDLWDYEFNGYLGNNITVKFKI